MHSFFHPRRLLKSSLSYIPLLNCLTPSMAVQHLSRKYYFKKSILSISSTLDLGCGYSPTNPFAASDFYGVDLFSDPSNNIVNCDLSVNDIPFPDSSFDFITAFDFLEHIPRISWPNGNKRMSFICLMNEIHRALKAGGLFLHSTPVYPAPSAFFDPTHVNICTPLTFSHYFSGPTYAKKYNYGFSGSFELLEQRLVSSQWCVGLMKCIK